MLNKYWMIRFGYLNCRLKLNVIYFTMSHSIGLWLGVLTLFLKNIYLVTYCWEKRTVLRTLVCLFKKSLAPSPRHAILCIKNGFFKMREKSCLWTTFHHLKLLSFSPSIRQCLMQGPSGIVSKQRHPLSAWKALQV